MADFGPIPVNYSLMGSVRIISGLVVMQMENDSQAHFRSGFRASALVLRSCDMPLCASSPCP